jgi:hypothetical protein
MKRFISILILALFICTSLLALSAEELFAMVMETSPKAKEIQQTRRNEFLDQVISSLNGPSWSVSLQSLEITGKDDLRSPFSLTLPSLDIGFSTPENKEKLAFEAKLSIGGPVFTWDTATARYKLDGFSYSLRTGMSKNFEFKSWDTTNYQEGLADQLRNNSYRSSVLQFENAFLEDMTKVMKWSEQVRDVNSEALLLKASYDEDIRSGKLEAGSPDATIRYAEVEMKLKEAEQSLDSGEEEFAEFRKNYGMDPMYIDSAQEYELEFTPPEEGNSEVVAKYYEYLAIMQQIDEKTGKSSQLNIKASLEPKVTMDENFLYKTTVLSGEIGASYTSGNFSMDMTFSTGYDFNGEVGSRFSGPTLSIGFSWTNTPQVLSKAEMERLKLMYTNYSYDQSTQEMVGKLNWNEYETTLRNITNETLRKESLELEKLEYSALVAEKEWKEALAQYVAKCAELQNSIKEYKNKREVFLIKYEADKKAYEQVCELFDQNKTTAAEVLRITHLVEMDAIELVIYNMRSHILYNEIEMIQM